MGKATAAASSKKRGRQEASPPGDAGPNNQVAEDVLAQARKRGAARKAAGQASRGANSRQSKQAKGAEAAGAGSSAPNQAVAEARVPKRRGAPATAGEQPAQSSDNPSQAPKTTAADAYGWLLKNEPAEFSVDDLAAKPNATYKWDGIRNGQARALIAWRSCRAFRVLLKGRGVAWRAERLP